jgi:hypothetical protein
MSASQTRIITAIQTCRRQVAGLADDDVWRDFLERTAGSRSLRAMKGPQLGRVMDALHAAGAPRRAAGKSGLDPARVRMIRGLWIELSRVDGGVRDRSEAALRHFVKRLTRVDRLEWLSVEQAQKVTEALKDWSARCGIEVEANR